ncbi:Protein of uncharacterised function (DUF2637) [Nocardia farcinica]|uniref:DUF2637 domain-containing protein n=1 Tax=Nocardia farcinica TaxID=37329 RepID=UPI001025102E|nr:DUF2637 domain-containing protein [Nocardia farcinica]VFA96148.1 Protein of uncharacterised function (DUF2637) [Nocardia farcinica]
MTSTATVHPVDPPSSTVNPVSTGRFDLAELTALAMTIVIGAGAFAWSFAALTDLAVMAGITPRLAWAGPIFVDGAIVQSAVALVSLQRRARQGVVIPLATKAFFWGELFAAEAISVVGNGLHAAESGQRLLPAMIAAAVAGAAPLFGLAATHGLTALIEVPRAPKPAEAPESPLVDDDPRPVYADSTRLDSDSTGLDSELTALDSAPAPATETVDGVDSDPLAARDAEIRRRYAAGESTRKLGAAFGLSHSRVAQIVKTDDGTADEEAEVLALVR